jgi:polyhydroxyalkanoate synthesis repressor PhaR
VNLEDVAQLLKNGEDVRVVDVASGKDITRLILTQIIVEDAKAPDSAFPVDLLRQMIISSGRASQETALRYMKTMLDIYQDTYRAISPGPFEYFRPGAARPAPAAQPFAAPAAQPPVEAQPAEVDELKQRLAELEKLVSSLSPKKKPSRKSARKR